MEPLTAVELYAPWCGHCQQFKNKYEEVAKSMKQLPPHPNVVLFYGIAIDYEDVDVKCMTVIELCSGSLDDICFRKLEKAKSEQK